MIAAACAVHEWWLPWVAIAVAFVLGMMLGRS